MAEPFPELVPWLVWSVPIAGAILTPAFAKISDKLRDYLAVAFAFLPAALSMLMLPAALEGERVHSTIQWIPSLGITAGVLADPLSIIMANVVSWISFLIMVYSLGYMKGEANLTRYWFFMNFFIGNMLLIVLSDNLLQLFFGWEGVGLCSYALIGFWHSDEKKYWVGTPGEEALSIPLAYSPSHAGMKAFITTKAGDVAFLSGILILYYASGTFEFTKLASNIEWASTLASTGLLVPVGILIFGGAIGKSAQFPLQEWLPDAMAGPTAVSALIHAATMVKAGVFLVARVGPIFYSAATVVQGVQPFFEAIAWIGVFTAFLAATQAAVSREVKKVLAYSTVSQIGYMMLGLGAAGLALDYTLGFTAGFFHLVSHAIFKAAMFMGAGALIHAAGSKYMDEMGGLKGAMKATFVAMLIAAASLSGMPFLSGFWSKDAVLAATLAASRYQYSILIFVMAAVTALITAFYSFRMIGMIFFGERSHKLRELEKEGHHIHEAPKIMWVPYTILAAATLAIGFTGPFFEETLREALSLYLESLRPTGAVVDFIAHRESSINFVAIAVSIAALAVGAIPAYYFYIARRGNPASIVESSSLTRGLYRFLVNRWYINSIYYRVFAYGMQSASTLSHTLLEKGVIDRVSGSTAAASILSSRVSDVIDRYVVDGAVNLIAKGGQAFSNTAKRVQTGVTEHYIFAVSLGILLVLIIIFLVGGAA